ncbi:MAG: sodium:solute symporter family protein [Pirellulales bacterium]
MNPTEVVRPSVEASEATAYVVLGFYLALLLGLGLVGFLRSRTGEEDYFLAGRSQGWLVSSLTIMATFFSSFALLGAPAMVYQQGAIFALFSLNVPLAGACVYVIGARMWRIGQRFGYVTPGDMVGDYYQSHMVRLVVALAGFLYVVPYVVMQMKAGGLISETLFGGERSFEVGATLLALITTLYIMVGGMRSVAWTDVVQGLLLVTGMFLGGFVAVRAMGGLASLTRAVADLGPEYLTAPGATGNFPISRLFTICVFGSIGSMLAPAQWMRYHSARSPATLRRAALIFAAVLAACFLFGTMLVGLGGRVLYPDVADPDQILVVLLGERVPVLFPAGLGVVLASTIVVAIMASSMSTADSNLHALSAVLTRDVYDRYLRPGAAQRERLWVGRLIILVTTVAALALVIVARRAEAAAETPIQQAAIQSMAMIASLGFIAISFSVQLLPIVVDIFWIRRGSATGAWAGMLAGMATVAIFSPLRSVLVGQTAAGATAAGAQASPGADGLVVQIDRLATAVPMLEGAWGLAVNVAVFAAISALTRPPDGERTRAVHAALAHRPARP